MIRNIKAFGRCVGAAFNENLPESLGWWIMGIIIGCLVAGIIAAVTPLTLAAVVAGCALVVGVTLGGSALVALAKAVWDCI